MKDMYLLSVTFLIICYFISNSLSVSSRDSELRKKINRIKQQLNEEKEKNDEGEKLRNLEKEREKAKKRQEERERKRELEEKERENSRENKKSDTQLENELEKAKQRQEERERKRGEEREREEERKKEKQIQEERQKQEEQEERERRKIEEEREREEKRKKEKQIQEERQKQEEREERERKRKIEEGKERQNKLEEEREKAIKRQEERERERREKEERERKEKEERKIKQEEIERLEKEEEKREIIQEESERKNQVEKEEKDKKIKLKDLSKENEVYFLSDESFEIINKGVWFVDFYIPGCGHCKALAPIWDELALLLSQSKSKLKIAKIDCSTNISTRDRFKIQRFPTIKLFRGNKMYSYSGNRDVDSFIEYLSSGWLQFHSNGIVIPPPLPKIDLSINLDTSLSSDFYTKLSNSKIPWIVCFYALVPLDLLSSFWNELAHKTDQLFNVGSINLDENLAIKDSLGIEEYPQYGLVKNNKIYFFSGFPTVDKLKDWILNGIQNEFPQYEVSHTIDLISLSPSAEPLEKDLF